VLQVLEGWYGAATTELRYRNPYELAVAVVLSAQCTDVRVHQTTPAFFERFPDCETLARAELAGVSPISAELDLCGDYPRRGREAPFGSPSKRGGGAGVLAEVGLSIRRGRLGNHPLYAGCKRSC